MCFNCESYDVHHVGHIHRAGKKVVRRHNGRLVTERLLRPLLHLNDGSEFVGYCNHPRLAYGGSGNDYRRRERSGLLRMPMRMAGIGPWGGDDHGYCGRGPGTMRGEMPPGAGYSPHGMFEQLISGMGGVGGGAGHGQDHGEGHWMGRRQEHICVNGNRFRPGERLEHTFSAGLEDLGGGRCGPYTTNEGWRGNIENREPGRGQQDGCRP